MGDEGFVISEALADLNEKIHDGRKDSGAVNLKEL